MTYNSNSGLPCVDTFQRFGKAERSSSMEQAKIINFPQPQEHKPHTRKTDRVNAGKTGRVYSRGGKLWVDFRYLGERVREPSGLDDNPTNRANCEKCWTSLSLKLEPGFLNSAKDSRTAKGWKHFTRLEGRNFRKDPKDILFGDYVEKWWAEMRPGMSESQARDYPASSKPTSCPILGTYPSGSFDQFS